LRRQHGSGIRTLSGFRFGPDNRAPATLAAAATGCLLKPESLLGDYASSFAGVAPETNLVVQGFEVEADGAIVGIPADYYQLFAQAYGSGARLHSNSWGDITGSDPTNDYGGYPYGAQRTDAFVWDHPDMTIFAAAGNAGVDGDRYLFLGYIVCVDGNGVINPDSLLSPYAPAFSGPAGPRQALATLSLICRAGGGGSPTLLRRLRLTFLLW
jgi:hypothetical protein